MEYLFDREKYLKLRDSDGIAFAITALHNEMRELELQTFETQAGYKPELWTILEEMRHFSQEIWDSGVEKPSLLQGTKVPDPHQNS